MISAADIAPTGSGFYRCPGHIGEGHSGVDGDPAHLKGHCGALLRALFGFGEGTVCAERDCAVRIKGLGRILGARLVELVILLVLVDYISADGRGNHRVGPFRIVLLDGRLVLDKELAVPFGVVGPREHETFQRGGR
ncbi:Uncharacterised protein [Mycobacteroides abscessus subsp. massiliense]|nr:Uncharacterised protein [Mycobacteroides abscessus subsp. massiliense]